MAAGIGEFIDKCTSGSMEEWENEAAELYEMYVTKH